MAQGRITLFKLEKWDARGLAESARTHIQFDKQASILLYGEPGEVQGGKRWGQPAELVHVALPENENATGTLTWSGVQHSFTINKELAVAWGRDHIGPKSIPGGEHILHGSGTVFGYKFTSDESYPLTFKLVSGEGYVYMCGRGTITAARGKQLVLGKDDTIETYLKLMNDKEQVSRERASQALGYLTTSQDKQKSTVIQVLSDALLNDRSMEVRRNSAQALGRIGDRSALDVLSKAREDQHEWVRLAIDDAINRLSPKAKK
jgi:hypothetical protein